jgi:ABC-type transporter Mla MlaB component
MGARAPNTVAFTIRGPIARDELPGLSDRVCAVLHESRAEIVVCDVCDLEPDAVTVDALARLQLAAQRSGCRIQLRGASADLCALIQFMGLSDVICTWSPLPERYEERASPQAEA